MNLALDIHWTKLLKRIIFKLYEKWTDNDTHGAALYGLHSGEVDFVASFFMLTIGRFPQMTIISKLTPFRYFEDRKKNCWNKN